MVVASSGIGVFAMGELVQVQEDGERKDDDDGGGGENGK